MKESLLEVIRAANVPRTLEELAAKMELPASEILPALEALVDEGRAVVTRRGKYAVPEKVGLFAAHVSFQRNGSPLARPIDGSPAVPLRTAGLLRPMPGDLILARPDGDRCELHSIVRRARDNFAAYVRLERRSPRGGGRNRSEVRIVATAVPCDPRIPYDVALEGDLSFVRNNEIVQLKIEGWPERHRPIRASVLRVLGNAGSMRTLLKAVAEDHGFSTASGEAVDLEAAGVPSAVAPSDLDGREDLRGLEVFTIDGADARDFDDAVSLEPMQNGWRLGVHIADVSHYVHPGSAIDGEALSRGTSLYLPGYTVPMLPECLSNHLCSLMPDVDRLAMSLMMDVQDGRITGHRLALSVIHSRARLTYQAVNRMFEGGESSIPDGICQTLLSMREVARALRARRMSRGCVDLDMPEPAFVLNEKNEPVDILFEDRGEAERIIEDFMLAANETVAAMARHTELPFVYRVHEDPDGDRLKSLESFLSNLNLHVHLGVAPHPGVLQGILERAKAHPARDVIRQYLLRALKKARYSESPLGHYALALEDYCHFTSPIRRYPDLIVHRMLKLLLSGRLEEARRMAGRMPELAAVCSDRESAATAAERQADGIMAASYMSHQIGRKFNGTVSGVTGWGLYVTLPNGVEGLVRIGDLDDYYEYDDRRQILTGSATGTIFRLGDRVRVCVDSVNVPRGEVNFLLVPPGSRR